MTAYTKHVTEPWFSYIQTGVKTIEGRLYQKDWVNVKPNDTIVFFNDDLTCPVKVTKVVRYSSFAEYLQSEPLKNCCPHISTVDEGVAEYRNIFTAEDEAKFGVVAVHFELV
jgi:ASC-1-like (ASCH) protein